MKILIIHTFGLGDMIMFSPALQLISRQYPDAQIDFIIFQKASSEPIKECVNINQIYYSEFTIPAVIKTINKLNQINYDYTLHTSGTSIFKISLFILFIKSKYKIGEYKYIKFPWYSYGVDIINIEQIHRVKSNLLLANGLLGSSDIGFLQPAYCFKENTQMISLDKKISIGIHPGCNEKFAYKRWEIDKYILLIENIYANIDCNIYVFIGNDEINEGKIIKNKCNTIHLVQKPLNQTVQYISNMNIMITNDSGLGHIASCFDVQIITIFANSSVANINKISPFSSKSNIINFRNKNLPSEDEVQKVFNKVKELI